MSNFSLINPSGNDKYLIIDKYIAELQEKIDELTERTSKLTEDIVNFVNIDTIYSVKEINDDNVSLQHYIKSLEHKLNNVEDNVKNKYKHVVNAQENIGKLQFDSHHFRTHLDKYYLELDNYINETNSISEELNKLNNTIHQKNLTLEEIKIILAGLNRQNISQSSINYLKDDIQKIKNDIHIFKDELETKLLVVSEIKQQIKNIQTNSSKLNNKNDILKHQFVRLEPMKINLNFDILSLTSQKTMKIKKKYFYKNPFINCPIIQPSLNSNFEYKIDVLETTNEYLKYTTEVDYNSHVISHPTSNLQVIDIKNVNNNIFVLLTDLLCFKYIILENKNNNWTQPITLPDLKYEEVSEDSIQLHLIENNLVLFYVDILSDSNKLSSLVMNDISDNAWELKSTLSMNSGIEYTSGILDCDLSVVYSDFQFNTKRIMLWKIPISDEDNSKVLDYGEIKVAQLCKINNQKCVIYQKCGDDMLYIISLETLKIIYEFKLNVFIDKMSITEWNNQISILFTDTQSKQLYLMEVNDNLIPKKILSDITMVEHIKLIHKENKYMVLFSVNNSLKSYQLTNNSSVISVIDNLDNSFYYLNHPIFMWYTNKNKLYGIPEINTQVCFLGIG